jgi:hypothetical protein
MSELGKQVADAAHGKYAEKVAKLQSKYNEGKKIGKMLETDAAFGTPAFVTKDSGKRAEFPSGMRRDTQEGKPRYDLITPVGQKYDQNMIYRWAMLMARGAEKYGDRNWEKADSVTETQRFKASAYRHFMQWFHGEVDEDHAAAVYFNIAAAEFTGSKPKERHPEWDACKEG